MKKFFSMYSVFNSREASPASTAPSTVSSWRSVRGEENGGYLHRSVCFLTYAQSSFENVEDFTKVFDVALDEAELTEATYYGCLEQHKGDGGDGDHGIHFHVLVQMGKQVNWSLRTARNKFCLTDDKAESVNIVVPNRGQSVGKFNKTHVEYVEKDGITFGERPNVVGEKAEDRRRKWLAVQELATVEEQLEYVAQQLPAEFFKSFGNINQAIKYLNRNKDNLPPFVMPEFVDETRFVIPREIIDWEVANFLSPEAGRKQSLLLVGNSRTGKSTLARYLANKYGKFSDMENDWDIDRIRPGMKSAVFHDMKAKQFPYLKVVFGCQLSFSGTGRYRDTRFIEWGVPSIWVCNFDEDPRDVSEAMRTYIEVNSVVYEVPDERPFWI